MGTCGVVLAAGAGSRYGMPKVLAHDGRWLVAAIDALSGCDSVIVVMGAAVVGVPDGVTVAVNEAWSSGMGGSLRVGLDACRPLPVEYAVIMPVDTPDVGVDVVTRVVAAAMDSETGLARAMFGDVPGHPVVMARRWWRDAAARAVGDEGARAFLSGRVDVVAVQCGDLADGGDHDFPDEREP
ncbi:molybdopterin-guanine dinucleotide biosynthesis protein MobA [Rhodococcoides trifolii]|uniref:Molybdopterin-guanine dinucleotide biosynthesis protein MobA n=1 Tax=Rhodococcoides trifolii TaxID=908250 RepID=A0A917D5S9_9NOCA|nr:molybdopterin-guanine dinucleotide biosynthesis protein MobA [Rhodococcus trifolii]